VPGFWLCRRADEAVAPQLPRRVQPGDGAPRGRQEAL